MFKNILAFLIIEILFSIKKARNKTKSINMAYYFGMRLLTPISP